MRIVPDQNLKEIAAKTTSKRVAKLSQEFQSLKYFVRSFKNLLKVFQTALHPQVGAIGRGSLGSGRLLEVRSGGFFSYLWLSCFGLSYA
jgi:hypothetical protein